MAIKTCRICGKSTDVRVWPLYCRCGYMYADLADRGVQVGVNYVTPGLGDRIAIILARMGIKKRKGCGCQKRQEALNDLGKVVAQKAKRVAQWLHPR